ncbi:hypothetical protein JCM9533A_52580 [Catenuloplanes niger JCM 9533]
MGAAEGEAEDGAGVGTDGVGSPPETTIAPVSSASTAPPTATAATRPVSFPGIRLFSDIPPLWVLRVAAPGPPTGAHGKIMQKQEPAPVRPVRAPAREVRRQT